MPKQKSKDLYAALGVSKTASADEIRRAYRKLARQHHPDVNKDDKHAEERFKEVSGAYEVLSDPQKRELYDEFGEDSLRSGFDADKARAYRQWTAGGGGPSGLGGDQGFDLSDLFGDLFGGHSPGQNPFGGGGGAGGFGGGGFGGRVRARGQDILATVDIDLAQAIHGAELELRVPQRGGETVKVRIPPGADTGSRLRVKGKGAPGLGGGPAGDVVIETRVRPHPFFRRQGLDLLLRLPVTLHEALAGARIDVPTPHGPVKLRVPPGSQNGSTLRLKGKGVPKGKRHGNLLVELDVRLPEGRHEALAQAAEAAQDDYAEPVRAGLKL